MTTANILADKILRTLFGRSLGLDVNDTLIAPRGVLPDFGYLAILDDDFLAHTMSTRWAGSVGSDSGNVVTAAITEEVGGALQMTTGASATTTMAVNGAQLVGGLNWEADKGGLTFEAKVKLDAITSVALYVGFGDQVSALEMPFTLSSGSLTSNITDGCGFLFDTAATAATIKLVGVATDVDATTQDTGLAYVAATYRKFRIEVDTAGKATFYIDGNPVGSAMTGALTKTVALTPIIAGFSRSAAVRNIGIGRISLTQLT